MKFRDMDLETKRIHDCRATGLTLSHTNVGLDDMGKKVTLSYTNLCLNDMRRNFVA